MRLLQKVFHRKVVDVPRLPEPNVPYYDRNQIEHLTAYDNEIRVRALDIDGRVIGRQRPQS